ncbi:MAG: 30S ribosomal protein S8 [Candidatus Thermoplasmatota archaeon]|jgi:small subunit ribosomal protein S8|nr:30S ribosomal protein S8 [Candidatus Thermoplasmatota archaeon]MCL5962992.1 30S ribosomal protein S8 [Candidatus Thermoplasmatota archaeon]
MLMDPLNDALVVIKNAERMGKRECVVIPASKLAGRVFSVMVEYGYIKSFEYINDGKAGKYKISLKGAINDCGAVKPRYSVKSKNIEKYEARLLPAQDYGILILTTTEGVISNTKAREHGVGGKILAYVY